MEGFELIKQGAEARIYKGSYLGKPSIVKERFVKKYRVPLLDDKITKERIKAEGRAITHCRKIGLKTPTIYLIDFNRRLIIMEYFQYAITVKEFIDRNENNVELQRNVALKIGNYLNSMYKANITHGDLTTSNMLLVNKENKNDFQTFEHLELVLIDFGLASTNSSYEDKAVDLYVLERALISTHANAENIFKDILISFKDDKSTMNKLEDVRARGRKRTMIG